MLEHVVECIANRLSFRRRRKDIQLKVLAVLLYHLGLSYRQVKLAISGLESVSHEAIRKWNHMLGLDIGNIERRERCSIAIDETKIKISGRWHYLWAAIDLDTKEILAIHLSRGRACIDAMIFLRKALRYCSNKPIVYVDGGPWYRWPLKRLGIPFKHKTFGERATIEQWFSQLKHRTKRFWNRFPHNCSLQTALTWLTAFVFIYNLWRC